MATVADLKRALIKADKAGDIEAAGVFASQIKKAQSEGLADTSQIITPRTKKERSIGETIKGAGEAALALGTGATAGALGAIGGTLGGIVESIRAGQFGTREGAELTKRRQAEGAQALTYAPTTQAGQEMTAGVAEFLAPLEAFGGLTGELQAIGALSKASRPVIQAKAIEVVPKITAPLKGLKSKAEVVVPQRAAEVAPETEMATIRRQRAAELEQPIDLTAGQATREFGQQQFERETAKQGELGAPIREKWMDQSEAIKNNFDIMMGKTGAQQQELQGVGTVVDKALNNIQKVAHSRVKKAYDAARSAGEMEEAVTLDGMISKINDLAPEAEVADIIKFTKQKAVNLGLAEVADDGMLIAKPGTLRQTEILRQSISDAIDPLKAPNLKFGSDLKRALDDSLETAGGAKYKQARAIYKDYADQFKSFGLARDILGTKKGTNDRKIAVESVFNKSIMTAPNEDIVKLKSILDKSDEGKQAWSELRGATIRHIRDEAIKGSARDERGNPIISPAQMERVISSLDKSGKLETVFGEKGAQQLRTMNDVAKDLFTAPPGAVNTSNTASIILAAMDMVISGTAGMPAPILSAIKMATQHIKDAKVKARVAKALEKKELPVVKETTSGGKF